MENVLAIWIVVPVGKADHEKLVKFGKNSTVNIDFKGIAWDIGKNP